MQCILTSNLRSMFTFLFLIAISNDVIAQRVHIVTESLPPFQIVQDNKVTGLATDVVHEVMSRTELEYDINAYPWNYSYNLTLRDANTCIYSMARIEHRETKFIWVGAVVDIETTFYSLKSGADVDIKSLEDAKNYKTVVIRDDVTHHFLAARGFVENEHFYVAENSEQMIRLLKIKDNFHIVLVDPVTLGPRLAGSSLTIDDFEYEYLVKEVPTKYYLACNTKMNITTLKALQSAFNEVLQDGTMSRINNAWKEKSSD